MVAKTLENLEANGKVYVCGDWRMSGALQLVLEKYLIVRNRITWEREKGRAARANWKNCSEDIWFCTVSNTYTFNANAVKLKRASVHRIVKTAFRKIGRKPKTEISD